MSITDKRFKVPSLAQHFDAPEDYTGHFAWLCGYSADALFLDNAAERFTRLSRSQRANQGRVTMAVLLDPGNPAVSIVDAPGVAHLPIKEHTKRPFQLLHAKVALLGYRHEENHNQWRLRLLVSTGNWTRQTLEESLDLAWRIEIASESLSRPDVTTKQHCADISAAWKLLEWIQRLFDDRLLNASVNGRASESMLALQQVRKWVAACSKKAEGEPRFFDNRNSSLLSQLPGKIKAVSTVKRNYLAMGSGFYETPGNPQRPPDVPLAIRKTLSDEGLLTARPDLELYVNPDACQSIASTLQPLNDNGFRVLPAAVSPVLFGEGARRSLHAKFLFSANSRDSSNTCSSPWVYLGSGNLTRPGFTKTMNASSGNLEAGVVFTPGTLYWQKKKTTPEHHVVTNLLPIHRESKEFRDINRLNAGSDMPDRDELHVAPPVVWLVWHETDKVRELRTDGNDIADFELLDSAGTACLKTKTGFKWSEARPREVTVRWRTDSQYREARVAVIDQYGRIAAAELPAIDIEEACWQLADFPIPPSGDDDPDEADETYESMASNSQNLAAVTVPGYPIRQMMDLVESIASKQTEIDEMDWLLWCRRLEQTLGQTSGSTPVSYFRDELGLNPLSPLRHRSFRPTFAEQSDSDSGRLYDQTLDRIERDWKVCGLSPIGRA